MDAPHIDDPAAVLQRTLEVNAEITFLIRQAGLNEWRELVMTQRIRAQFGGSEEEYNEIREDKFGGSALAHMEAIRDYVRQFVGARLQ